MKYFILFIIFNLEGITVLGLDFDLKPPAPSYFHNNHHHNHVQAMGGTQHHHHHHQQQHYGGVRHQGYGVPGNFEKHSETSYPKLEKTVKHISIFVAPPPPKHAVVHENSQQENHLNIIFIKNPQYENNNVEKKRKTIVYVLNEKKEEGGNSDVEKKPEVFFVGYQKGPKKFEHRSLALEYGKGLNHEFEESNFQQEEKGLENLPDFSQHLQHYQDGEDSEISEDVKHQNFPEDEKPNGGLILGKEQQLLQHFGQAGNLKLDSGFSQVGNLNLGVYQNQQDYPRGVNSEGNQEFSPGTQGHLPHGVNSQVTKEQHYLNLQQVINNFSQVGGLAQEGFQNKMHSNSNNKTYAPSMSYGSYNIGNRKREIGTNSTNNSFRPYLYAERMGHAFYGVYN